MMLENEFNMIDLTGKWNFVGQPVDLEGNVGRGEIAITIKQNGTEIVGDLVSVIEPYINKPPDDPEQTNARIAGQVVFSPQPAANLLRFTRVNNNTDFTATFIGIISNNGQTINGYFVNNQKVHGSFVMSKSL